jgi:hypothetical protein
MNDEIIEMARESGLETQDGFSESVFYFAKLVAEKEREACAMTAENTNVYDRYSPEDTIADAIRARGQA